MSDLLFLIICYPLLDCLVAPAICSAIADCLRILVASSMPCSHLAVALPLPCRCLAVALPLPCRHLAIASLMSCHRLTPLFARHRHHHVCRRHLTRIATATVIAIGVVGCRYPYWCCCHHQRHSSHCRLCCHCRRCPDVSVTADAPVAPPLPLSFVTDPATGRLRLATVPRQRRHQRRRRQWKPRRRRSTKDVTVLTPNATWTTPSSAWQTESSTARLSRQQRAPQQ